MSADRRSLVADVVLFGAAFLLRFGWMGRWGARHATVRPDDLRSIRQVFDGHERLLYEALVGRSPGWSSQAWPASVELHRGLGLLTADPRAMLLLPAILGALTAVFVAVAVRRHREGPTAWRHGLAAGLLVAVLPEHVAWSTSAVPVVHGLACLTAAAAVRSVGLRAVFLGLAAAFRPELAVPALFFGLPGLAAVAVAGAQLFFVGRPPGADLWPVLRVNLPLLFFVGPPLLGLSLLALRDRTTGLLAGAAATVHLVGASFSDYGARHALPAGIALCALASLDPRKPWLPLVVGLGLLPALVDLQGRWHTPESAPQADLSVDLAVGCTELTEEPPVPGQPLPSWVALVGGDLDAPCVTWGEAPEHTEWSSRGLRDRSRRMHATWTLSTTEARVPGHGRPWRHTWRLVDGPGLRGTMQPTPEPAAP
jgi:hypothetical protein